MRRPSRRTQAGQMVPLFAILALVLFAFAALALDGGLALSDRRSDQNIADNSALAGALDLETVTANTQQTAVSSAITYAGSGIGLSSSACPAPTATSTPSGSGYTIACTIGSYDVTAYTPPSVAAPAPYSTTDARHMVEVRLTHHNTPALMRAAKLGNVLDIGARAVAVHGIPIGGHPHAVWSTYCKNDCQGGGNTLSLDGPKNAVAAEVDSGPDPVSGRQGNGVPCNDYSIDLFSNEKLHVGNPVVLDINGGINHSSTDAEYKKFYQYWVSQPAQIGSNVTPDLTPPYLSPTTTAATYHAAYNNGDDPTPTGTTTLVFSPGHYTKSLTVGPGGTVTLGSSTFTGVTQVEFLNGVYFFDNGANVIFNSNTITSYSQDFTLSGGMWTATTFTQANFTGGDTTTDGVEFYMGASAGYFWAKQGNVYLQGPSNIYSPLVPSPTPSGFHPNHITVFVDNKNNSDTGQGVTGFPGSTVTNPLAIGSESTGNTPPPAYPSGVFHEQGVVLVQNASNNQGSSTVFVAPTSLDYRLYAVQGQAVAPYVGLNVGNVTGAQQPTACQDDTVSGKPQAGKLVQYSPKFVPTLETGAASGLVS